MHQAHILFDEAIDPEEERRFRAQSKRIARNSQWLEAHWSELSAARGRFIAIAGEEAFIADSDAEARALARTAHPDDDGVLVQYVWPTNGPRIYRTGGSA